MRRHQTICVSLAEAGDAAVFGGKAAMLARMMGAGFSVPWGFVLPDDVRRAHLSRAGLGSAPARSSETLDPAHDRPEAAADRSAERLRTTPLDATLTDALQAIAENAGEAALAVRSSAVGEDSEVHSFAGQLDTVLGVRGSTALGAAVAKVWASLWSSRSLYYQRRRDVRIERMGVIVQAQVDARHAGVMFSRALSTSNEGHRAIIIEYCSGLGERLVSGAVDPGRVLVDRRSGGVISHTAGEDAEPLSAHDIAALAAVASRLEHHFGQGLDIEWAIDGANQLWLLQARPITGSVEAARVIWTNANIAENFPEPVSPFLYSIVRRGYSAYFRNLGLSLGISRRRIAAMEDSLDHIVGVHGGRLYYNLSNIHALISLAPGGRWLTQAFNDFVGTTELPANARQPARGRVERGLELVRVAMVSTWRYLHAKAGLARFAAEADAFAARTRLADLASLSAAALSDRMRWFLAIRLLRWNGAALADVAAMVCYGLLQRRLRRALPAGAGRSLHNRLLIGLPGLASHEPVERLWTLSRQVRNDPRLRALFEDADYSEIATRLREGACFAEFHRALREFLEHWGFRNSGELMLTRPSPEEDPCRTLELLSSYVALEAPSPKEQLEQQAAARRVATDQVSRHLTPNAVLRRLPLSRAWWFRLLLAATQGAIRMREKARQAQAKLYVHLRHLLLQVGQRLVASGYLQVADDVFFLQVEEVEAVISGCAMFPYDLGQMVRQRRSEQARLAAMEPPDSFELGWGEYLPLEAGGPVVADAPSETPRRMTGCSACGGRVVGRAMVLADASEAGRLRRGDIVVTRQTDPGWACAFFLASGLVIERGGMLSHGAIIARELGIPTVVGVRDATRQIQSGDRLCVDGDHGVIDILS